MRSGKMVTAADQVCSNKPQVPELLEKERKESSEEHHGMTVTRTSLLVFTEMFIDSKKA